MGPVLLEGDLEENVGYIGIYPPWGLSGEGQRLDATVQESDTGKLKFLS